MFQQQHTKDFILLFIMNVIKPFRWFIVGQFIIVIIWAIDMSLRPYLIKVIIDKISIIKPLQAFDMLSLPAFMYIGIGIISLVASRVYEWITSHFYPNLKKHIGVILMDRMMKNSHNFYQSHLSGNIVNKVNDVTIGIPTILNTLIDQFFSNALALLIAIYTVWIVNLKFAIGLTFWIVIFLTISIKQSRKAKVLAHQAAAVHSTVIGNIVDIRGNIGSVRLFGGKKLEIEYLNESYQHSVNAEQTRNYFFIKMHTFQESSFVIFQAVCFWWLITGINHQTIISGDFVLIIILNISIINCLHNLSRNIREFVESLGRVTQGLYIIHSSLEVKDKENAKDIVITKGEILFENIQFYYNRPLA